MKRVVNVEGKSKVKKRCFGEVKGQREYGAMDVDSRVSLIQEKKSGPSKGLERKLGSN